MSLEWARDMDIPGVADMAVLIREEETKLFGPQVEKIKTIVKQHDDGLILHSEMLAAIAATYHNA